MTKREKLSGVRGEVALPSSKSVKRGLVSNLEDWKWSNYRHYRFREIAIVEIESEWTARDREQKERWRCVSTAFSPENVEDQDSGNLT